MPDFILDLACSKYFEAIVFISMPALYLLLALLALTRRVTKEFLFNVEPGRSSQRRGLITESLVHLGYWLAGVLSLGLLTVMGIKLDTILDVIPIGSGLFDTVLWYTDFVLLFAAVFFLFIGLLLPVRIFFDDW